MARILLVDDDRNQCVLFSEALEESGHEGEVVYDGRAAVDRVTAARPDLVVLDINMPVMDGLDALGKILGNDPRVPVILHTAYSSYRDSFVSMGAVEYLVKSSNPQSLCETVKRILGEN